MKISTILAALLLAASNTVFAYNDSYGAQRQVPHQYEERYRGLAHQPMNYRPNVYVVQPPVVQYPPVRYEVYPPRGYAVQPVQPYAPTYVPFQYNFSIQYSR